MGVEPLSRLRHLLQTLAFCLVIASLKAYLQPGESYAGSLVYSIAIGSCIWALIDFGRTRVDPDSDNGWPRGWRGALLVGLSIPLGFAAGIAIGDLCFGRAPWHGRDTQELIRSVLLTVLASAVISYYFYSSGRSAGLARRAREARQEAAEARLKLLEAQLEPHMLFNTLANLRMLIAADTPRAEAMLDHLIAYLRATLDGSRAAWHPLSEEFARLDDYLALMAVRMGDRLAYRLDLPPMLAQVPVPPLLLQPLVENAIRHGLEPQVGAGRIDIGAQLQGDTIVLTVADTGRGMPFSNAWGTGFGTRHVEERIASAWDGRASVRCEAIEPHGTRLLIQIPAQGSA
ncbi:sensor histidine kinase [Xylophilus rhododendri]|uniref:Sensor histidine kinase n=1 Tax=Xylophilus rhododendri TaxID=2697032 RepID=A0A857JD29_9BURK|nr:histidine kinase [Xylophilus rhododendri]QHJ01112.1 sensor histidine kinase [Xylophilus rhododendri]